MNRIFVDFEMNVVPRQLRQSAGLRQEIIEIGAVRMDGDYQVTDTFRAYIHPQYSDFVDSKIYRLTGITSRDVAARPLLRGLLRALGAGVEAGFASNACLIGEKGEGKTVFVRNIPMDATQKDLFRFFKRYGRLVYVKLCQDK